MVYSFFILFLYLKIVKNIASAFSLNNKVADKPVPETNTIMIVSGTYFDALSTVYTVDQGFF